MARKILVVDDEKLIVKGIHFSLLQDGFEVDCAYDGAEALNMAKNGKYDVILLDVMLPEMDGFTVCQQIRSFSDVPITMASWMGILLTGVSAVALVFIVVRALLFGDPVAGWPSTASIITFIGGVQLFVMGVMGQYIAKTYMEVKNRPHYIIKDTNCEETQLNG